MVNNGGGTSPYTYSYTSLIGSGGPIAGPDAGTTFTDLFGSPAPGVTYTVTITDANGCLVTATTTLLEPPPLSVTLDGFTNPSCNSENAPGPGDGSINLTVTGGTMPYTFAWTTPQGPFSTEDISGLTEGGDYFFSVTDAGLCIETLPPLSLTEPAELTADISVTDAACFGGDGQLDLTVQNAQGGVVVNWSTGATTQAIAAPAGNYSVAIEDGNGCVASASASINEGTPLEVTLTATDETCAGASNGTISATVTGGSGTLGSINWDNNPAPGLDPLDQTGLAPGTYGLFVQDAICPEQSLENITVGAGETITAEFNLTYGGGQSASVPGTDSVVLFSANGQVNVESQGNGSSFAWDFGNGNTATSNSAENNYTQQGAYTLTHTVTDPDGLCTATEALTVVVESASFFFPTSFSPNGDGFNDNIGPLTGGGVPSGKLEVYARWGDLVYSGAPSWDGTHNGQPAPEGVYVYTAVLNLPDGTTTQTYTGTFTLIR